MLRSFFISLSKAQWLKNIVTRWNFARKAASRFVAGETIDDAIQVVRKLNSTGINVTLDHLGENTSTQAEALQATEDVVEAIEAIHLAKARSNVSIKLSQIGLTIDRDFCKNNLLRIVQKAKELNNFIRIDMEDSSLTDITLDLLFWLRDQGYENVGIVIQAYLYRSDADVEKLMKKGIKVRLVKGAYKEPGAIAYPKMSDVNQSFDRLTQMLIDASVRLGKPKVSEDGVFPPLPAIASHDEERIKYARKAAESAGLPQDAIEFQMLYGIRQNLQEQLSKEGVPVRVYVPYGGHWFPYFMRRLAERPANVWFILSNLFR